MAMKKRVVRGVCENTRRKERKNAYLALEKGRNRNATNRLFLRALPYLLISPPYIFEFFRISKKFSSQKFVFQNL